MIETFEIVSKAVADASRVRILKLLEGGELCVCHITAVLDLAPATISKHLAALRAAGLVQQRREGRWIHYRLAEKDLNSYTRRFLDLVAGSLNSDPRTEEDLRLLREYNRAPIRSFCEDNFPIPAHGRLPRPTKGDDNGQIKD